MQIASAQLKSRLPLIGAVVVAAATWWLGHDVESVVVIDDSVQHQTAGFQRAMSKRLAELEKNLAGELAGVDRMLMASSPSTEGSESSQLMLHRIIGLQQVTILRKNEGAEWGAYLHASLAKPEPLLRNQDGAWVDGIDQLVLNGEIGTQGWLETELGLCHYRIWKDAASARDCVAIHLMDQDEVTTYLRGYLETWADQQSKEFQTQEVGFQIVDSSGRAFLQVWRPDSLRPPDTVQKIPSALGDWQLELWHPQELRSTYHVIYLVSGSLLIIFLLGLFVSAYVKLIQQRKSKARMSDFLMRVAHDLRTPMTSITLEVDVIQAMIEDGETKNAWNRLKGMQTNIMRMSQLLNNALDVSRGLREVNMASCFLDEFVVEVIDSYRPALEASGVKVEISGLHELEGCWQINTVSFERILLNLLDNVRRHASCGKWAGITFAIVQGTRLRVRVSDRGQSAGKFSSRHKSDSLSEERGSGMGLLISQKLAEQAGGGFAEIPAQEGKIFEFWLPCERLIN